MPPYNIAVPVFGELLIREPARKDRMAIVLPPERLRDMNAMYTFNICAGDSTPFLFFIKRTQRP